VVFVGFSDSSTNKTDRNDITEIVLKVALNTMTLALLCRKKSFEIMHRQSPRHRVNKKFTIIFPKNSHIVRVGEHHLLSS
jgi:hypothetical protein